MIVHWENLRAGRGGCSIPLVQNKQTLNKHMKDAEGTHEMHRRAARWVRLSHQLRRSLAKATDLVLQRLQRIIR